MISRYTFNSPGSIALNKRLEVEAAELGREAELQTGVAGGAAQLNDYSQVTRARIPFVVAAITLATFLVLVLVLRALPLAAIAVGLNLATVAVAFGILTLLFNLPEDWPLGGRSYVDAVGATAIFGVVFGLSIDYAVFLLVRMREQLRPRRRQRRRDRVRAGANRAGDHRRRGDHDGRLRRLRRSADRHRQPARRRAHRGGAARRHRGPHRPAAGADAAARRPGLVAAAIVWIGCCPGSTSERRLTCPDAAR